jgi:hypothetical protein
MPCSWNGEIPSIFELPLGFSVEIAVAGAKKVFLDRDARFFLAKSYAMVFPR